MRQALALAIDRKVIAELIYGFGGAPTCEILVTEPYILSGAIYGGRHSCTMDVTRAKQLLDAAGWLTGPDGIRQKNGKPLLLTYQTTINPTRQRVQAFVKAAWAAIGVSTQQARLNNGMF